MRKIDYIIKIMAKNTWKNILFFKISLVLSVYVTNQTILIRAVRT